MSRANATTTISLVLVALIFLTVIAIGLVRPPFASPGGKLASPPGSLLVADARGVVFAYAPDGSLRGAVEVSLAPQRAVRVPDLDGDGWDELVRARDGALAVTSGRTGQLLWSAAEGRSFGAALAGIPDVDGDRRPDLLVGAPEENRALVLSGREGAQLLELQGTHGFGWAVGASR